MSITPTMSTSMSLVPLRCAVSPLLLSLPPIHFPSVTLDSTFTYLSSYSQHSISFSPSRSLSLFHSFRHSPLPLQSSTHRHFSSSPSPSSSSQYDYDVTIIGGGIVGLSTARHLLLRHSLYSSSSSPLRLLLIEKESSLSFHQSKNNSGVLHAGIYYKEGSMRAMLCVDGIERMYKYCDSHGIHYEKCGKMIVAAKGQNEGEKLEEIYKRGVANGVKNLQRISGNEISKREENIVGDEGIWSPNTGIINFVSVSQSFGREIIDLGGRILLSGKVIGGEKDSQNKKWKLNVQYKEKDNNNVSTITTSHVILCGGLHSDTLSTLFGGPSSPPLIPFRGRWFHMRRPSPTSFLTNIYPVPNPSFPFLGIHFTPLVNNPNEILVGPTAALAWAREGYTWSDYEVSEVLRIIGRKEIRDMIKKNFRYGIYQWGCELLPKIFLFQEIKKYYPKFEWDMMEKAIGGGAKMTSGVRAQLMGEGGKLIEDFLMEDLDGGRVLSVRNAPSPAATASLAIGERIAMRAEKNFGWK